MKDYKILLRMAILLLLVVLTSIGCTFYIVPPEAIATLRVTPLPPMKVALKSFHGQYVTAMGEDDDWLLTQKTGLDDWGWFTLHHLANGKIALETYPGKYVTAPRSDTERLDWMLRQESELRDCGQFELYDLGGDRVAFRTCADKFVTAGDGGWDPPWSVGAGTEILLDWEIFTPVQQ